MLIQLGSVWVDPSCVEVIYKVALDGGIYYRNSTQSYSISLGVGDQEKVDSFAAAVNNALQTQSYGNDDGVEKL